MFSCQYIFQSYEKLGYNLLTRENTIWLLSSCWRNKTKELEVNAAQSEIRTREVLASLQQKNRGTQPLALIENNEFSPHQTPQIFLIPYSFCEILNKYECFNPG